MTYFWAATETIFVYPMHCANRILTETLKFSPTDVHSNATKRIILNVDYLQFQLSLYSRTVYLFVLIDVGNPLFCNSENDQSL